MKMLPMAEVEASIPGPGEMFFWWLGQHGFVFRIGDAILLLDAFLSPLKGRLVPPLMSLEDAAKAHLALGSHDHLDHIDRESWRKMAALNPALRFVVPDLVLEKVGRETGIPEDRFVGLDDGSSTTFRDIKITGIAAAHELLDRDPATGRYPSLGFVVEGGGFTLYHSGDCCVYEGLGTRLRKWKFDIMFLPINGRDAERLSRGCIGNMCYQEAADLAGYCAPRLTVPAHYDMFAGNPGDPEAFRKYMAVKYPKLPVHVCEHARLCRCQAGIDTD